MKYIKLFEEHSIDSLSKQKDDLDGLREIGIISPEEYTDKIRDINRRIKAALTSKSNYPMYSTEWFNDIRSNSAFDWLITLIDSPEYSKLIEMGVVLSSSFNQLMNRTLVFSRTPDRDRRSEFAIALFGPARTIRRLVPKTGSRDMDMVVKSFNSPTELDFFKEALSYVADNIDFTTRDFSTKRTMKAQSTKQEAESEFKTVLDEFIKMRMPDSDDSQIRKWSEKLHSVIGWTVAEIKPATKALKKWLTTNNSVNLSIYSYHSLDQEIQEILDDPRLIVNNRAHSKI